MKTTHSRRGVFSKVGENLYRYSSNGVYYARYRNKGKEIQYSLKTTDREFAKRLLKGEMSQINKVDLALGKMTLRAGRFALRRPLRGHPRVQSSCEIPHAQSCGPLQAE
jgi:hypothetical protein